VLQSVLQCVNAFISFGVVEEVFARKTAYISAIFFF